MSKATQRRSILLLPVSNRKARDAPHSKEDRCFLFVGQSTKLIGGSISAALSADENLKNISGYVTGLPAAIKLGLSFEDYTKMCYCPEAMTVWKPWLNTATFYPMTSLDSEQTLATTQSVSSSTSTQQAIRLSLEIGHCVYRTTDQTVTKTCRGSIPFHEFSQSGSNKGSPATESEVIHEVEMLTERICLRPDCAYWMKLSLLAHSSGQLYEAEGIVYSTDSDQNQTEYRMVKLKCQEAKIAELQLIFAVKDNLPITGDRNTLQVPENRGSVCKLLLEKIRLLSGKVSNNVQPSTAPVEKVQLKNKTTTLMSKDEPENYRFNLHPQKSRSNASADQPASKYLGYEETQEQRRQSLNPSKNKYRTVAKQLSKTKQPSSADVSIDQHTEEKVSKHSALLGVVGDSRKLLAQATQRETCFTLQQQAELLDPLSDRHLIAALIDTCLPHFVTLACDIYANFLVQIFFTISDGETASMVIEKVPNLISQLSRNKIGVFTIQTLISKLVTINQQTIFLSKIQEASVFELSMNALATFMFKKLLITFPAERTGLLLLNCLKPNFLTVASDKHGICVIKLLLSALEKTQHGYLTVLHEFQQHLETGKLNSHFNFGIHHLLESAYSNGYCLSAVEELILSYLSATEGKLRLRSRSVLQTLLLFLRYPHKDFYNYKLLPAMALALNRQASPQELSLLHEVGLSYPEASERVKFVMSCFLPSRT